jgi:hypothetical protein
MKPRKRKGGRNRVPAGPVLGIAWYKEAQWDRLREVCTDGDSLEVTFEQWFANATKTIPILARKAGLPLSSIVKVVVDVDEFLAWCKVRQCEPDGSARVCYVTERVLGRPIG